MNVLLDISHPAQVHLMRNMYFQLFSHGHNVVVTTREMPSIVSLRLDI